MLIDRFVGQALEAAERGAEIFKSWLIARKEWSGNPTTQFSESLFRLRLQAPLGWRILTRARIDTVVSSSLLWWVRRSRRLSRRS